VISRGQNAQVQGREELLHVEMQGKQMHVSRRAFGVGRHLRLSTVVEMELLTMTSGCAGVGLQAVGRARERDSGGRLGRCPGSSGVGSGVGVGVSGVDAGTGTDRREDAKSSFG